LRLAERARDPAGGQSTEEVLMLDSQTKEELRDQLPKFQGKLREQVPDIEDRDLQRVQGDPDDLVRSIARKSGQDERLVERRVTQLVMQAR
jgi:uncharacterized protein YjbJ (UPF0337 family)